MAQFSNTHLRYTMPQYKEIDQEKYDYEGITPDDIWVYKVHLAAGVQVIDQQVYMNEIYAKRDEKNQKPWFIAIVRDWP